VGRSLVALALVLGCHDQRPLPRELSLTPKVGRDDRSTPITIAGRFIAAIPEIDRRDVERVRGLRAWLGGVELETTISGRNQLGAVVPEAMPPGPLTLELVDPLEQRAELIDAFCVLGPAAQVATIEIDAPTTAIRGEPFALALTALDAEGALVDRFEGFAPLSGAVDAVAGPFAGGVWTGTVAATAVGALSIDATVDLSKDPAATCATAGRGTAAIDATAAPARSLTFVTPPQTIAAGECSAVVEVGLIDAAGDPTIASSTVTIDVSEDAADGDTYSDPACATPERTLRIAAGGDRAGFYFSARSPQTMTIDATSSPLLPAAQVETITVARPRLAITTPAYNTVVSQCTGPISVVTLDSFGQPLTVAVDTPITISVLGAPGFDFYRDPLCASAIAGWMPIIPAGTDIVDVWFTAQTATSAEVVFSSPGYTPVSQTYAIAPSPPQAMQIIYTTPPRSIVRDTCSPPVTIQISDAFGNPVPLSADTTVSLSLTGAPPDFALHSDVGCATPPLAELMLAAGEAQSTFYFDSGSPAFAAITASAPGLTPAMQAATVFDAPCSNGMLDAGELCDDGNAISGDGCASDCTVELGYICARAPSVCLDVDTTYVVDDDTCPATGTGTPADPYCTIGAGLARPNVIVLPGNYSENLSIGMDFHIVAEDGAVLTSNSNSNPTIRITGGALVQIEGLWIQSQLSEAISVEGGSTLVLSDSVVGPAASTGIEVHDSASLYVQRTLISGANDGLLLGGTGTYDLQNNIIANNLNDGIEVNAVAANARLWHLTIADNGDQGMDCNNAPGAQIMNSILWGNGVEDLDSGCSPESCDFAIGPASASSINEDPLFTSDYHLQTNSPCIDRIPIGTNPSDDFDRQSRPIGNGVEIGADEVR
jgi:cysteine-rich repeat protein